MPVDILDFTLFYTRFHTTLYSISHYFIPDFTLFVDTVDGSVNKTCG